jgi:DNA-binding NtrC family response regulator
MRLLIVGSLQGQIGAATKIAMDRGAKVTHANDLEQALAELRAGRGADLVLCDVTLDIGRLVRALATERICTPVVACGVGTDARRAVDAIRAGAKEYLPLPPDHESHQLIYEDEAMGAVIALADQVAGSEASILITGESGTGKEVLARYVHRKSSRADKPFISVNCAAIPDNLLESELFGHEKGAFTGAIARRVGKFEEADGGTLLLDEISEMDVRLQAKLLRAIQEREIDRVGGTKPVKINIRIIATSNRDLADAAKRGTFREDLFYRLNVVNLRLPALRERPRDILALARHFAHKYAEANGVPFRPIAPETERLLISHPWRGNVRELENTVHRAVLLSSGSEITPEAIRLPDGTLVGTSRTPDMPGTVKTAVETAAAATRGLVGRTVADVERDLILDTLDHCLGNRTHAANILGISIRTLRNKLREYTQAGLQVAQHGETRLAG